MKIQVRYFASVRERLGPGEVLALAPAEGESLPATVGELRTWLAARSEGHAAALDPARGLRTAHNHSLCGPDEPIGEGSEVAFFPPVTGG